jgi:hypothetical protein
LEKENKPHFIFQVWFFFLFLLLSVLFLIFVINFLIFLKDYFTVFPFFVSCLNVYKKFLIVKMFFCFYFFLVISLLKIYICSVWMDDGMIDEIDDGRTDGWKVSFHPMSAWKASFHPEASRPRRCWGDGQVR